MHATTTIAEKLVRNRVRAPIASAGRPTSMQMPTVASGGTSDTAMATPGSASEPVRRAATHAPAAPAARATPRSRIPGCVLAAIDGGSTSGLGMNHETTNPITTTISAPSPTWSSVMPCQRSRPVTSAPANAMIAPPNGAITMAPMIEAVESWYRPKDAISPASASSAT